MKKILVFSLLVALAAVLFVGCQYPTTNNTTNTTTPPAAGTTYNISAKVDGTGYYVSNLDGPVGSAQGFIRSKTPQSRCYSGAKVSQVLNSDGSITVNAISSSSVTYVDSGVYVVVGKLSDFNGLTLTVSGTASVTCNMYFDIDNNGEFFTWATDGATFTGTGDDGFGCGPSSTSSVLVNSDSNFYFQDPAGLAGNTYTLAKLKAGSVTGISGDTKIAVWFGVSGSGDLSSTLQTLTLN